MKSTPSRHIVITDQSRGLPYSKGLMTSSLMISGLPAGDAYRTAERIETVLMETDQYEVTSHQLRDLAVTMLSEFGQSYANTYLLWQSVSDLDIPLVLLIGGATGVGKSTISTQLAARLGISRVISTDAVREVLRSAVSEELLPSLYRSSFEAGTVLRGSLPRTADRLIIGFQEQVSAVALGVRALIRRAIEEGTDMIIEGAHAVPGFLGLPEEEFQGAVLVPVVLSVEDEALHRSHFLQRAQEARSSRHDHYLENFDKIRVIQDYIAAAAKERGVKVVESYDLDTTLQELVTLVVKKAIDSARIRGEEIPPDAIDVHRADVKPQNRRVSRLKSWEVLSGRRRKN